MNVTYIKHSGFLIETNDCYYLFDYYKGTLPSLNTGKPIFVFSSHGHSDHYNPDIFSLLKKNGMVQVNAILSEDIPEEKYPAKLLDVNCTKVTFHQTYCLPFETMVYTLRSTDEGVAFLLKCPEGTIYHAGDLNDWVWDGEPESDNREMTSRYQKEICYLRDISLDFAMIPLDPRQEKYYAEGILFFLKNVSVKKVYPMHYWEQPQIIDQFLKEHHEYTDIIIYPENNN